jgi:hypothetical protein
MYVVFILQSSIIELTIMNFLNFIFHFWFMFFIALSIFVPYWGLGWVSLWKYEKRLHANKEVPYVELVPKEYERNFHKRHFFNYRILPWLFFLGLSARAQANSLK